MSQNAAQPPASGLPPRLTDAEAQELFQFPCDFPIKVMGEAREDFVATIRNLLESQVGPLTDDRIEVRGSSSGRYTSVTLTVVAHSRDQLDQLYLSLTSHPWVKVAL